jgi:pyridoxine 5-phosphate synthase
MNNTVFLGVNIDHVATVRQARGTAYPDPVEAAKICMCAGAVSITMHLREDRRHVQDADVFAVRQLPDTPLNLEMAVAEEIVAIALALKPAEVCLVPEKREEVTTEGGLDVAGQLVRIREVVQRLNQNDSEVSLFVEPVKKQLDAAVEAGARVVELHTGTYCDATGDAQARELQKLIDGAEYANHLGLQVNAGHGINLENIGGIMRIPYLHTLNIGHSIIARAVFVGLDAAVREMIAAIKQ